MEAGKGVPGSSLLTCSPPLCGPLVTRRSYITSGARSHRLGASEASPIEGAHPLGMSEEVTYHKSKEEKLTVSSRKLAPGSLEKPQ